MVDVRLRLTKIDELQFLTCVRHGVWGSKTDRLKRWSDGEYLALIVGREVAGLAIVSGTPFISDEPIWLDDLYPFRIPLTFKHAATLGRRLQVPGEISDALMTASGGPYGFLMVTQRAVTGEHARRVIEKILAHPNDLTSFRVNLDRLISEAQRSREAKGLGPGKGVQVR